MKAVFIPSPKQVEIRDIAEPEPKDDLVVVKIMSSLICGTEHIVYEKAPIPSTVGAAGHEAAGVVWKTDKAKYVKEGDKVSIYPTTGENCMRCIPCWSGEWQRCENKTIKRSQMGTHTQYMLIPEYMCLPIPDDMPFSIGAMIDDCIGTPYRAIKRMGVNGSNTVFITGAGPIGAAAAVIVKFLNGRAIIVDSNEYRLEKAKKNGADYVINPEKDNVLARVRQFTDNKGADIAIDCSGVAAAQIQCLEVVRSGGKVAFLGIRSETTPINIPLHCILKELTIIGSWASTPQEHMEIVALLRRGMPIEKIITHQFNIDAAQMAFDTFFSGKAVKVAINLWEVE